LLGVNILATGRGSLGSGTDCWGNVGKGLIGFNHCWPRVLEKQWTFEPYFFVSDRGIKSYGIYCRFCGALVRRRKHCVWSVSGVVTPVRQQCLWLLWFCGKRWMLAMWITATIISLKYCPPMGSKLSGDVA